MNGILKVVEILVIVVDFLQEIARTFLSESLDIVAVFSNGDARVHGRPNTDRKETHCQRCSKPENQSELKRVCPIRQLQIDTLCRKRF